MAMSMLISLSYFRTSYQPNKELLCWRLYNMESEDYCTDKTKSSHTNVTVNTLSTMRTANFHEWRIENGDWDHSTMTTPLMLCSRCSWWRPVRDGQAFDRTLWTPPWRTWVLRLFSRRSGAVLRDVLHRFSVLFCQHFCRTHYYYISRFLQKTPNYKQH